ncbi:MAG: LysR substrate-binding domain-containing protein [Verrucomicrobium sp.]
MNADLLDLDLVRTFVAVVDCRSFTVAAGRLGSTQSTVSQKIGRLEEQVGQTVLDRSSRDLHLTEAGEKLIGYARRLLQLNDEAVEALAGTTVEVTLRLGVPEDFAAGKLTRMLVAFTARHPHLKLEVTSGLSRDLRRFYERGELDVVLVKQRQGGDKGVQAWPEPMCWIDSKKHPTFKRDPVPLVAFPAHGLYRDEMISTLEGLGRAWRISYSSASLASLQAAVADGLGISLLPVRTVLPAHRVLGEEHGLRTIDTMEIVLHHRPDADEVVRDLAGQLARLV